jgi:prepilin-type N-terminal cleavage/methylation domain-containing protein
MKYIRNKKLKDNKGFTLIEALIAIIILAIVSVLMVQGVNLARKAYSSNRIKTEASSIANREIEKIRSTPFADVSVGTIVLPADSKGFTVSRSISLILNSNNKIKQVKITVSNSSLASSINVVTEIFEMGIAAGSTTSSSSTTISLSTTTTAEQHPVPENLIVFSDNIGVNKRIVVLQWQKPLISTYEISYYNIYRSDGYTITNIPSPDLTIQYPDNHFNNKDKNIYTYFVKAYYSDNTLSQSSNTVTAPPN